MERLLQFIGDHPVLSVILLLVVFGGLYDLCFAVRGRVPPDPFKEEEK